MSSWRLDQNQFKALIAHRRQITSAKPFKRRIQRLRVPTVPTAAIIRYRTYLNGYFGKFKDLVRSKLIPRLPDMLESVHKHHPVSSRKDDATDDLKNIKQQILLELRDEYTEQDVEQMAKRIGEDVSSVNRLGLLTNIKQVANIDLLLEEPYLDNSLAMFAVQNADLIGSVTDDLLDKVSNKIYDAFRNGDRAESLAPDIEDILDVTDSKAAFIARDQIGKLNGQLDRLRQSEIGVEKYIWRGMDDGRERDTHLENNGEIFSWDDPPVETGHPGEDYQCRCWAEPVLDDLINGSDDTDQSEVSENEA